MKKVFITLLLIVFGFFAFSEPVSVETAGKVAANWLKHYSVQKTDFTIQNTITLQKDGVTVLYVFNFSGGGWAMVAADDAIIPVIAYSETETYDVNNIPPHAVDFIDGYIQEAHCIIAAQADNTETRKQWDKALNGDIPANKFVVNPLLGLIKWNQDCYYNNSCPSASGGPCGKAYAGCVATAMAQIMKYWAWPTTGNGSKTYTPSGFPAQTANFGSATYVWSSMPNSLSTYNSEVAEIIYHCGVSVEMAYSASGSGAYSQDVPNALVSYFRYKNTASFKYKSSYTPTNWINLLKAELDAGRPIQYSGSDGNYGHAWVCDGYNSSNQFHMNWGWSGYCDNYYTIGSLNVSSQCGSYQFNQDNCAVIGIEPLSTPPVWIMQNTGFSTASRGIDQIFIVDPNTVWAKAYDGATPSNYIREFTRTTNGGTTWTPGTITFTGSTSYGVANIHAFSGTTAFAAMFPTSGTGGKIVKTTNGGTSWTEPQSGLFTGSWANFVHFFNSTDGVAMGDPANNEFYIIRTTNGGTSWTQVAGSSIPNPLNTSEYGVVRQYDGYGDNIWFGTNYGRIYRSTDKGATWNAYTVSSGNNQVTPIFKDANTGVAVVTNYSTGAYVGTFKTTNGGANWTQFTPTGFFVKYPHLDFVPGTSAMWVNVSAGNGLGSSYSTNDCVSFNNIDTGSVQYTTVKFHDINTGWAGGFNSSSTVGGIWKWQNVLLVGTEEQAAASDDIKLYPNPLTDVLNIEFSPFADQEVQVAVYNLLGDKILSQDFDPVFNNLLTLDLSGNTPGIYLVSLRTGSRLITKRVVLAE